MTSSQQWDRRLVIGAAFLTGLTTLAVEFTASRMVQTVYGTSMIVWANVIGLVLLFLTIGYFLGGWLSDRNPAHKLFYLLVFLAGNSAVLFLLVTSAVLKSAAAALSSWQFGPIASSLAIVALALAVPVTLLGMLAPFAIRLSVRDVSEAGRVSGMIYAVSTMGSLLGTYLPVLLVIPLAGSRWSAVIFGGLLMIAGAVGMIRSRKRLTAGLLALPLLLGLSLPYFLAGGVKNRDAQVAELESAYNYIEVVQRGNCRYLLLNEGFAYHSYYCQAGRSPGPTVWNMMAAAPYLAQADPQPQSGLIIGLAAGSSADFLSQTFPGIELVGIELDPAIVEIGQEHFNLAEIAVEIIIGDGRYEMNQLERQFDIIIIDAFKLPYIPWHMTTEEFFEEVRGRLAPGGVLAINAGRVAEDRRLIEALAATLLEVFPSVVVFDTPSVTNSIMVASESSLSFDLLAGNIARLGSKVGELPIALKAAYDRRTTVVPSELVFRDDRAPLEPLIDSIALRYLASLGDGQLADSFVLPG